MKWLPNRLIPGIQSEKKKKFLSDYYALGIFYVDSSLQPQEVSNIFILILQWWKPKFERLNSIPKVNQPVSEHRNLTSKAIPLTMALPLRPSGFLSWHFTATVFSHQGNPSVLRSYIRNERFPQRKLKIVSLITPVIPHLLDLSCLALSQENVWLQSHLLGDRPPIWWLASQCYVTPLSFPIWKPQLYPAHWQTEHFLQSV